MTEPPGNAGPEEDAEKAAIRLENGRRLFAGSCEFVAGAMTLKALPPIGLPEIAFAGRSNVGKSSLVNALTGRKTLARTSQTPGRTRQLNFFDLGNRLLLVDLPGYGFAKAAKDEVRRWTQLIETYLKGRPSLMRVMLLIDGRHGLKPPDREMMTMLDAAAVVYQIVLTKVDKVPGAELEERLADTAKEIKTHAAAFPEILATSSAKETGIAEMRAVLADFANS